MEVFAIRRKSDGFYMPAHMPSKAHHRYTKDEPKKNGGPCGPRLFPSKQSAQNSLNHWCQGICTKQVGYRGILDHWGLEEILMQYNDYEKQPDRDYGDMEIVQFQLTEI